MTTPSKPKKVYRTQNIGLVCYLNLNGFYAHSTEEGDDGRRTWSFYRGEVSDLVADYYGDEARVNPRAYNQQFGKLKHEIYD